MKLTFLGTRGAIQARSRRHRRHTALLVEHRGARVMIDCGTDWRGRVGKVEPAQIVLTHAHPDHAEGLADGAPCGVWATAAAWQGIADYPLGERQTVLPRKPFKVGEVVFEAFEVEHSLRCPAVAYRICAGGVCVVYSPDVVFIHERAAALGGAALYIGDGATLERSLVRRRGDRLVGHTPVREQLAWCAEETVPRAVFTHCGRDIVEGDERTLGPRVRRWAAALGLEACIACDGMQVVL